MSEQKIRELKARWQEHRALANIAKAELDLLQQKEFGYDEDIIIPAFEKENFGIYCDGKLLTISWSQPCPSNFLDQDAFREIWSDVGGKIKSIRKILSNIDLSIKKVMHLYGDRVDECIYYEVEVEGKENP